jgi:hypothetical protein
MVAIVAQGRWNDPSRAVGGGGDDAAAGGILFVHGNGIEADPIHDLM